MISTGCSLRSRSSCKSGIWRLGLVIDIWTSTVRGFVFFLAEGATQTGFRLTADKGSQADGRWQQAKEWVVAGRTPANGWKFSRAVCFAMGGRSSGKPRKTIGNALDILCISRQLVIQWSRTITYKIIKHDRFLKHHKACEMRPMRKTDARLRVKGALSRLEPYYVAHGHSRPHDGELGLQSSCRADQAGPVGTLATWRPIAPTKSRPFLGRPLAAKFHLTKDGRKGR